MRNIHKYLLISFLGLLFLQGCNFRKLLEDATTGATTGLKKDGKAIGDSLMLGVTNRLATALSDTLGNSLNKEVEKALKIATAQADEAVKKLGLTTTAQIVAIRDSILGKVLLQRVTNLRDDLLGPKTNAALSGITANAVRSAVKEIPPDLLAKLIHEALVQAAADSAQLQKLEKSLLGPEVAKGVQAVVDSAMNTLVRRYNQDLSPTIRGELGFFQKYTSQLFWGLIAGILAIIAFVWWKRSQYLKELEDLKNQLRQNHAPDHDTLTDLIVRKLTSDEHKEKLEPLLQQALRLQQNK